MSAAAFSGDSILNDTYMSFLFLQAFAVGKLTEMTEAQRRLSRVDTATRGVSSQLRVSGFGVAGGPLSRTTLHQRKPWEMERDFGLEMFGVLGACAHKCW